MSASIDEVAAVQSILMADGWCEKLPSANCKRCPIECFPEDDNEDLLRKARAWISDNVKEGDL